MSPRKRFALGILSLTMLAALVDVVVLRQQPADPLYSVVQVTTGLQREPMRWAGRTVQIRGVLILGGILGAPRGGGVNFSSPQGSLLVDTSPFLHTPAVSTALPYRIDATGRYHLNVLRTQPALLITGPVPPPTTDYVNLIRDILRRFDEFLTRPGAFRPDNRHVYRVQLLGLGRCPAPIASPCLRGVLH